MEHEANSRATKLWKPHPDDEADVREAMESVDRVEVLSVEASEAFLRWLEGGDDESWRDECEQAPRTLATLDLTSSTGRLARLAGPAVVTKAVL